MNLPAELISESITPDRGSFDVSAMARGQAGLPSGFTWRDRHYTVVAVLGEWKQSEAEGHRPGGERYYRRHYWKVRTDSGDVMTLYARAGPRRASHRSGAGGCISGTGEV